MQDASQVNLLAPPTVALILWLLYAIGLVAGVAFLIHLVVRAVRALEKRSTVAEELNSTPRAGAPPFSTET